MDWLRVKICCISSTEEAEMAVHHGADAIGLVSEMPSGPGVIDDASIEKIAHTATNAIDTFLLTSRTEAAAITEQYHRIRPTALQLVDWLGVAELQRLRELVPTAQLVQVLHVVDVKTVTQALDAVPWVDTLLLDSGRPEAAVKELGGTGRTHDWTISKAICRAVSVPVFLAGGLSASNVVEAVQSVQPFGIDICSGVRTNGNLDEAKLNEYFEAVAPFRKNRPKA